MPITATTVIDQILVTENGILMIRQVRRVIDEDGTPLPERYHRTSLVPGDDVSAYPERVQLVAAAVWTPAVIAAYQAQLAASIQP